MWVGKDAMEAVGRGSVGWAAGSGADCEESSACRKVRMAPEPSPWETREDSAGPSGTVQSTIAFCSDGNILDLICPTWEPRATCGY